MKYRWYRNEARSAKRDKTTNKTRARCPRELGSVVDNVQQVTADFWPSEDLCSVCVVVTPSVVSVRIVVVSILLTVVLCDTIWRNEGCDRITKG